MQIYLIEDRLAELCWEIFLVLLESHSKRWRKFKLLTETWIYNPKFHFFFHDSRSEYDFKFLALSYTRLGFVMIFGSVKGWWAYSYIWSVGWVKKWPNLNKMKIWRLFVNLDSRWLRWVAWHQSMSDLLLDCIASQDTTNRHDILTLGVGMGGD